MDKLNVDGIYFRDGSGRQVMLRGVNLSGATKMPPNEPTQIANNFSRHREVSFVGRPFPREEAREHLARLRHWGFNVLRFLTTWEAIEHQGPGQYDTEYLDYLTEMVALAGEYGFYVFIDPHQDVWSRMTGGDGAPGWTLEAVGFDIAMLETSESAVTMQRRYPHYPTMVWTTNYNRLACATMFTLFFAGNIFAPQVKINGKPAQDFLQDSFIGAMQQVAARLKDMPHVLGYGPLNEPGKGYIGLEDLRETGGFPSIGVHITPEDAILVGAGFPRDVPLIESIGWFPQISDEKVTLNPYGVRAWRDVDIWEQAGLWSRGDDGQPRITDYGFFARGDFLRDGLIPFTKRYTKAIRSVHPNAVIFVESTPNEAAHFSMEPGELGPTVYGGHWYDGFMLFSKTFDGETAIDTHTMQVASGRADVIETFKRNIAELAQVGSEKLGGVPTLIGEFGLAYDINGAQAYRDGDFSKHELALSLYYDALDANLVHSAQWNYTPDNSNQWGDNWNQEDLSIFSRDQQDDHADIHSGGRAIKGFCRPFIHAAAGTLKRVSFDHAQGAFTAVIDVDAAISAPTQVYMPDIWYGPGADIEVSGGTYTVTTERSNQMISWHHSGGGEQTITIRPSIG